MFTLLGRTLLGLEIFGVTDGVSVRNWFFKLVLC